MTLEQKIGQLLAARGLTLAIAESCTGGMMGARITSVSGSSSYFPGGIIAYSNDSKVRELGVDPELLRLDGAVSEAVACGMAAGVRTRFGADFGIGITGVAGPGGGTAKKPAGLVYIGLADGGRSFAREFHFSGGRQAVRESACGAALDMLREILEGERGPTPPCGHPSLEGNSLDDSDQREKAPPRRGRGG